MKKREPEKIVPTTQASLSLLLAFFIGWCVFYAFGTFFNSQRTMDQRPAISSTSPIGIDLTYMHNAVNAFINGDSAYQETNVYPPFTTLVFLPVVLIGTWGGFIVITLLTVLSLIGIGFLLNKLTEAYKERSVPLLFFSMTMLISYGFHFELERGQFNIISIFFVLLSLLFFIKNKTLFAILFFTIAVQLKLTPLLFLPVFLFLHGNRQQKILFFVGTVLSNIAMLFILGKSIFIEFVQALIRQSSDPFLWVGNHSLFNFCVSENPVCSENTYLFFAGFLCVMLLILLLITFKRKRYGFNPYIFALCGVLTLLLPPMSNDYKLSLLPIFLYPVIASLFFQTFTPRKREHLVILSVIVFLYTSTLFPHIYSPLILLSTKTVVLYGLAIILFICGIRYVPNETSLLVSKTRKKR